MHVKHQAAIDGYSFYIVSSITNTFLSQYFSDAVSIAHAYTPFT